MISLLSNFGWAQFGKNKVQYETPQWKTIQSKHFEILFPQNGYELAVITAEYAEQAYNHLSRGLDYQLEKDDKITIITHLSHNQFQQSNVTTEMPEESVGGFTEFLKTRVVIPYEGNWEKYRHVIHHELTHAILLRKYYGKGIQSVITGLTRMPLPLWYIEGLAEYQSRFGWDIEADMFLRDAVVNDWLPDIEELNGYMNYKGGQSILYYISKTYGKSKVTDLVNKVRQYRDFSRGVRSALGMEIKELNSRWKQWVKNQYWKTASNYQIPNDFAIQMTNREKFGNYINNAPAISPQGDRIVFLSDRSDYFDIWLMNGFDGKVIKRLIKGQRTARFEELHWLQSGISWDPSGTLITFGAKANGKDALFVMNTYTGKIVSHYSFELDGVYTPNWSPDGTKIAFQGFKNGLCDLYYITYPEGKLVKVTNDVYTDADPEWSDDSQFLLFTSDRLDVLETNDSILTKDFAKHPISQYDLYKINIHTKEIVRVTDSPETERSPVWIPNQNAFLYVSNQNGIYNLYRFDFTTKTTQPITNVLTGVFQPSISNDGSIAFTAFYKGGYDIYFFSKPLSINDTVKLSYTPFAEESKNNPKSLPYDTLNLSAKRTLERIDPSKFVFDDLRQSKKKKTKQDSVPSQEINIDTSQFYLSKNYRVKLTPDLLFASAGFSSFSGFQGMGQMMFSDLLGNHVIYVSTDLYYDIENTNVNLAYFYLRKRIDLGLGSFHNVYFFNYGWTRDRNYGIYLELQYPISKFLRIDGTLNFMNINRARFTLDREKYITLQTRHVLLPGLSIVKDNTIWGHTGPVNGERYRISAMWSPDFDNHQVQFHKNKWGLDFKTYQFDYRKYYRLTKENSIAIRLTSGFSNGQSPQRFFLGGESNSFVTPKNNDEIINDLDNVFFSTQITPLRGYESYEFLGTRFALLNAEFRYPLIKFMAFGWPLPAFFSNIRGASYLDIGSVWNKNEFKGTNLTSNGNVQLNDLKMGFGLGARIYLGFTILKYDLSWRTNWIETSTPYHLLSLGAEL
ncbi:MAG: hypothetical protein N2450_09385 [bacterium]|nr:hypothetical protein [bacterium]